MRSLIFIVALLVAAPASAQNAPTELKTGDLPAIQRSYGDLSLKPAPIANVSARVIDAAGQPAPEAGLQLQLQGAQTLSGRITASGESDFGFKRLTVWLSPEDGNSFGDTADVATDGDFSFTELRPTTYRLRVTGLPDGWYLESATLGQQDALNQGLNLGETDTGQQLEINLSPGASEIKGFVMEQVYLDRVPNALVQLFPDPANPHRADLLRTAATDSEGNFTIENVPPGRYRALAIMGKRRSETGITDNADDARIATRAGTRVSVAKNQSKTVELQLFPAHR